MVAGSVKRVLITGGTGAIGANLIRRLITDRCDVSVVVEKNASRVRLQDAAEHLHFFEADVTDDKAVGHVVCEINPQIVFHLASTPFNPPTISTQKHVDVIVGGTLHLLDALVGREGVRFVTTGSCAEYGDGSALREDHSLKPRTVLGAAKAAASILAQTYARLHGLETVVLRLFTPFGPWESPTRLIPHTILSALQGCDIEMSAGTQQRDWIYMEDVVDAMILAASKPVAAGSVFNICSGRGVAVREVVKLTLELMGNPVKMLAGALPTRPDEIMVISGDHTAARKMLGWQVRTSLKDGLRKTIDWFTQNREIAGKLA